MPSGRVKDFKWGFAGDPFAKYCLLLEKENEDARLKEKAAESEREVIRSPSWIEKF